MGLFFFFTFFAGFSFRSGFFISVHHYHTISVDKNNQNPLFFCHYFSSLSVMCHVFPLPACFCSQHIQTDKLVYANDSQLKAEELSGTLVCSQPSDISHEARLLCSRSTAASLVLSLTGADISSPSAGERIYRNRNKFRSSEPRPCITAKAL